MDIIGAKGGAAGGDGAAASGLIKDSSEASFAQDVLDASMEVPVIVDFWAPWCGPCKQLGPALEKAVSEAGGKVRMVKVNIDENQNIAAQLRIQSIPTVYAFFKGQPVDGFQGALPESQVREFVNGLAQQAGEAGQGGQGGEAGGQQGPSEEQIKAALEAAAQSAAEGDAQRAAAIYGQILQAVPDNIEALAGMLRLQLDSGDVQGVEETLNALDDETLAKSEIQAIKTALELAREGAEAAAKIPSLMEQVAHDPNNHEARFELAGALYAAGQREAAVEELLLIVEKNRAWNEEAARTQLLKYFEAWGPTDPLTLEARRKLSAILFS